jgi:probable addiction module antidote protein
MSDSLMDYDPAKALIDSAARAVFIKDAFESGDARHIAAAIGVAIRAFGIEAMAETVGLTVQILEDGFHPEGNPDLRILLMVLGALNFELSVSPRQSFI